MCGNRLCAHRKASFTISYRTSDRDSTYTFIIIKNNVSFMLFSDLKNWYITRPFKHTNNYAKENFIPDFVPLLLVERGDMNDCVPKLMHIWSHTHAFNCSTGKNSTGYVLPKERHGYAIDQCSAIMHLESDRIFCFCLYLFR